MLSSLYFTSMGASVVVEIEWKSEGADFTEMVFLDVIDGKPVVLRLGGGEIV